MFEQGGGVSIGFNGLHNEAWEVGITGFKEVIKVTYGLKVSNLRAIGHGAQGMFHGVVEP